MAEAIATYAEIVANNPDNIRALKALDRLYFQQESWSELADNLVKQLELTLEDPEEQLDLRIRLAHLREAKLEQVAAAIETYREVLELDGENDSATLALERLLNDEEHQLTVAEILYPIYQSRNDWQNLVVTLEIMVKHSLDPVQKIELLHQVGELYEVAGDDSVNAFGAYGRALTEDPTSEESQGRLERLARELDNWEDLVNLYASKVEEGMDEELAVMIYTKIAEILEHQIVDLERAAAAYDKVLEVDPSRVGAADSLERIFVALEDSRRLVQVILRKATAVMDEEEKKGHFFRAASIYEDVLEDQEAAIGVYDQVLQFDENDATALDNLEKLYIRLERWDSLKDIYAKKAELAEDDEDRKKILYILGQVYDTELKDVDKSIETYQNILEIDPEDYQAIQALDRLYGTAERWYDLLSILEREVELAGETGGEVVGLKHRIGALWQTQLGEMVRAVDSYREALELDPGHEPTVAALDAIAHGEKEPVSAAQVLEPIYQMAMEWEKLIDLLEVMVAHTEDSFSKVELLQRIAVLYETQLDQSQAAFQAYGRAFKADAANEDTVANMERLASETGLWEQAAQLYETQLESTLDGDLQITLLLRLARVYQEELQQPEQAIGKYQKVLDNDPEDRRAIMALDHLYFTGERWQELTEILRREISMAESDEEIIGLQFRLGQIFEISLGDLDNAIESYREILTGQPEHAETLQALELLFADGKKQLEIAGILEPLYEMAELWEKLARLLEVTLQYIEDSHDRLATMQRIAELHERSLYDEVSAFRWWGAAFIEDATSEMAADEVERLAQSTGGWEDLVQVYRKVVTDKADDTELAKGVLHKIARVFENEVQDLERAEGAHLEILQLDADDEAGLSSLDRIYSMTGQVEKLADILSRRIKVSEDTDEIIELQFRVARVQEDALGDLDAAIVAYTAVLDNDPQNEEGPERPGEDLLPSRGVARALQDLRAHERPRAGRRGDGRLLLTHGEDLVGRPRQPRAGARAVEQGARHSGGRSHRACRAGRHLPGGGELLRSGGGARASGGDRGGADHSDRHTRAPGANLGRQPRPRAQRDRRLAQYSVHRRREPDRTARVGRSLS